MYIVASLHPCDKLELAERAVAREREKCGRVNTARPPALAVERLLNADAPFQFLLCDSITVSVVHHSNSDGHPRAATGTYKMVVCC